MAKTLETSSLRRVASTLMPTKWGLFKATGYVQDVANGSAEGYQPHFAHALPPVDLPSTTA